MAPKCIFCKSEFCDKATLNKHQKTSKYCIKIQLENDPNKIIDTDSNECTFCKKQLTTRYSLNTHLTTCKTKKKQEEKKNEILIIQKHNDKAMLEIQKEKDKALLDAQNQIQTLQKILENIATKAIDNKNINYDLSKTEVETKIEVIDNYKNTEIK